MKNYINADKLQVLKTCDVSWARGIRFAIDITKGMVAFHTWNPAMYFFHCNFLIS